MRLVGRRLCSDRGGDSELRGSQTRQGRGRLSKPCLGPPLARRCCSPGCTSGALGRGSRGERSQNLFCKRLFRGRADRAVLSFRAGAWCVAVCWGRICSFNTMDLKGHAPVPSLPPTASPSSSEDFCSMTQMTVVTLSSALLLTWGET